MLTAKEKNYSWYLKTEMENYLGQWVVIFEEQIIAHGTDLRIVVEQAQRKLKGRRFMLVRVPDKESMIY